MTREDPEVAVFVAESGVVRAKVGGHIEWVMTADEAEEFAGFIEGLTLEKDAAREDARALRSGVAYSRSDVCYACGAVLEDGDTHWFPAPGARDAYTCELRS